MELRILGPFEVVGDDGRPADVGGRLPRALLATLALAGGHPVPASRLLADLWPDTPAGDRNRLQVHISRLRRVLGDGRIRTLAGGYALTIPAGALDADRFSALAVQGRAALHGGDPAQAARLLRQALDLWRGAPLADLADTGFAAGAIRRLAEARLSVIEDRVEADLLIGGHGELTGELEALVTAHPLRERLWGQLIIALYRAGRQGDALGAYQRARAVLADQLGVDPGPELQRLEAAVLGQDSALDLPAGAGPATADRPAGNLPAASSALIGRTGELGTVAALLADSRLVTIVGAGGVGKTRLAVEAARDLPGRYRDGIWLVELAPVGDDAEIPDAVGAALGVAPDNGARPGSHRGMLVRLGEFLARRQALLILDNCEHVIAAAARLAVHLLAGCPQLRILATSRESLMVAGEALLPLDPLAAADAVELFLARARAIAPGFGRDAPTMTAVSEICARLDGLPLAIELAAARMRALAPGDVLARLGDRFGLLTGGARTAMARHQTLRAVVDWSYELLSGPERLVFERMSVFAGPCPLAAAEQVCAGPGLASEDVPALLARLVDKSLVIAARTAPGVRYRMLQTLADYGRQRLDGRGELTAVRDRHARWAASVADVPDPDHGSDWFAAVREFAADIRRAMEWALAARDPGTSLAIIYGIGWFWGRGGRLGTDDDRWRWLTGSLALPQQPAALRVRALTMAEQVSLAESRDDPLAYGEAAVALARKVGDRPALAFAVMLHGSALAGVFGQRERAIALLEEAGALFGAITGDWGLGMSGLCRGVAAIARSEPGPARTLLRRTVDHFAACDHVLTGLAALRHLADLAVLSGHYDDAIAAIRQMQARLPAADPAAITRMAQLGCLHAIQGRFDQSDYWHARAEAAAGDLQYPPLLGYTCNARGLSLRRCGRLGEAAEMHHRALRLDGERDEAAALAHSSLGYIAELRGDTVTAQDHHRASLDAGSRASDRQAQALALEGLAGVAALRGEADTTGRLLGAAAALREGTVGAVIGAATAMRDVTLGRLSAAEQIDTGRAVARIRGGAAFDAGYAEGACDPLAALTAARTACPAGRAAPLAPARA